VKAHVINAYGTKTTRVTIQPTITIASAEVEGGKMHRLMNEFILDGLPESAKALDSLLARVHELDAEVAKARENAKPVVEDAYKPARVVEDKFNN